LNSILFSFFFFFLFFSFLFSTTYNLAIPNLTLKKEKKEFRRKKIFKIYFSSMRPGAKWNGAIGTLLKLVGKKPTPQKVNSDRVSFMLIIRFEIETTK